MDAIVDKIKKLHKNRFPGAPPDHQQMVTLFEALLEQIREKSMDFVLNNFSPAVINMKFNEIIQLAKNGKRTKSSSDEEGISDGFKAEKDASNVCTIRPGKITRNNRAANRTRSPGAGRADRASNKSTPGKAEYFRQSC